MERALRTTIIAALAITGFARPAAADQETYQRFVRCSAYNLMAVAVLDGVKESKNNKAIKAHRHAAELLMELASDMLDPYHVPPKKVSADVQAFYAEQADRIRQGEDFSVIMGEAAQNCTDFSFP